MLQQETSARSFVYHRTSHWVQERQKKATRDEIDGALAIVRRFRACRDMTEIKLQTETMGDKSVNILTWNLEMYLKILFLQLDHCITITPDIIEFLHIRHMNVLKLIRQDEINKVAEQKAAQQKAAQQKAAQQKAAQDDDPTEQATPPTSSRTRSKTKTTNPLTEAEKKAKLQEDIWIRYKNRTLKKSEDLKDINTEGGMVCDNVMDMCANILKDQFEGKISSSSFQATYGTAEKRTDLHKNDFQFFIQGPYLCEHHFLLAYHPANSDTVLIIDSLQLLPRSTIFNEYMFMNRLYQIYGEVTLRHCHLQRQGTNECAYYAVATALELLVNGVVENGETGYEFAQSQGIKNWMIQSLENKQTPFFEVAPKKIKKATKNNN